MFTKKTFSCIFFIFFSLLFSSSFDTYHTAQLSTEKESTKTLTIAFQEQDFTLNIEDSTSVFESSLFTALYSGLVATNPQSTYPEAKIASSWKISKDNTVYTFTIRENAKFSDGSPILAEDVKQSWLSVIQHETPFTYLFYTIKGVYDYINKKGKLANIKIEVTSNRTLRVSLEKPTSYFLNIISHNVFSISSPKQREKKDILPKNRIFSGPYIIKESKENTLSLIRNPYFWDQPHVPSILITFYNDKNVKNILEDFSKGTIQWVNGLYASTNIEKIDKKYIISYPLLGSNYLFFKTKNIPWNNPKIRRAISLLIPWDIILKENYFFPAKSFIQPIIGAYQPSRKKTPKQDKETALSLLKEAKYPNGKSLPPIKILVPTYQNSYNSIFDAIQKHLKKNLKTEIQLIKTPSDKYYAALSPEEYTIGFNSWIADFLDPIALLQLFSYPNKSMGSDYNNDEYRALLNDANSQNITNRQKKLQEAETFLLDNAVVMPLSHSFVIELVRTDIITGWFPNVIGVHNIATMQFIPPISIPYFAYNRNRQTDSN